MSMYYQNIILRILTALFVTLTITGCAVITPIQTIYQDSSGRTLRTETEYKVSLQRNIFSSPQDEYTFKDLSSAQTKVANFYGFTEMNNYILQNANSSIQSQKQAGINTQEQEVSFWFEFSMLFNKQLELLKPQPTQTKTVVLNTKSSSNNKDVSSTASQQTSIQQDITSTGNNATQEPLPQTVCNMAINGRCDTNTVAGVTAAVAVGVIGGITAGVVTAVNNQASRNAEEEKKNNLLSTIAIINAQKSGGGGGSTCTASQQAQGLC